MKVYVVLWLQSYDGPIFNAVFGSEEEAEAYVSRKAAYTTDRDLWHIEEHEV